MKKDMKQPGLFELSKEISDTSNADGLHVYVLTNRNNLLEILSSGLIKPARNYKKYYADAGQYCPAAVPLFLEPPSADMVLAAVEQDEIVFPVIIELLLNNIDGQAILIEDDYALFPVDASAVTGGRALVVPGCVHAELIDVIYFRTKTEMNEFQRLKYANVPDIQVALTISPDMFDGPPADSARLAAALQQAGERVNSSSEEISDTLDAAGGALMLTGRLAEQDQRLPLPVLAAMLEMFRSPVRKPTSEQFMRDIPAEYSWLSCLPVMKPADAGGFSPAEALEALKINKSADPADCVLFAIALHHLARMEPLNYSYDAFLEEVSREFTRNVSLLPVQKAAVYQRALQKMSDVLMGLDQVETFVRKYPAEDYPAAVGLLVFMLRKDPMHVLQAGKSFPALSVSALSMAVLFGGALQGRSLMPVECFPGSELKKWVDGTLANLRNMLCDGLILKMDPSAMQFSSSGSDVLREEALLLGDKILLKRVFKPLPVSKKKKATVKPVTGEKKKAVEPKKPKKTQKEIVPFRVEEAMEKVSEAPLPEKEKPSAVNPVENIRQRLLVADLSVAGQREYDVAVELCKQAGWADLVSTVIPLEGADFVVEYRKGKNEFRIPGFVRPVHRLTRLDEFHKRLTAASPNDVERWCTPALLEKLNALVEKGM